MLCNVNILSYRGLAMQGGALTKLKRLSSSRLRNASGASPQVQPGSDSAQPDHFAAALEKLRRDRPAEKQNTQRQGVGHNASSKAAGENRSTDMTCIYSADHHLEALLNSRLTRAYSRACTCSCVGVSCLHVMPGEDSQESPGQQRRARWDPMADTEDRLALQRLIQKAAALSAHPSPTKVPLACICAVNATQDPATEQSTICSSQRPPGVMEPDTHSLRACHPLQGQRRDEDSQQHTEGAVSFSSQLRLAFSAAPARSEGLRSKAQDSAQAQQAKENAEVLNEVSHQA